MNHHHLATRRQLFKDCGIGLGKIALASLCADFGVRSSSASQVVTPFLPKPTHYAPKAKRVIYLFMAGAPSQLDLFDYKPALKKWGGTPLPKSVVEGQRLAFIQPDAAVLEPQFEFARHGQSGAEISSAMPHLASIADDVSFIKTVHTDQFNHSPAQIFMNTGHPIPGRPSLGSWLSYGIGSAANDLPSFVVLSNGNLSGGAAMWGSGFLPSSHQGVMFRSGKEPILNLNHPKGYDDQAQRDSLDLLKSMNDSRLLKVGDPEIETRIHAYEMAYRMQSRAPELMDLQGEDPKTLEMYGAEKGKPSFAMDCLMARRLVERGTRFVQVYQSGWDHHSQVANGVKNSAKRTDQAAAALIRDLKQRGLLEDTLVVWGGEFGRTPMVEASAALGRSQGRDHHPQAFTMWFAGAGIKPGQTIGKTDDFGFRPIEDAVHVHDIQATILHLMGLDHEKLTYTFQGRPFRLTDVHGHVVKKLLS